MNITKLWEYRDYTSIDGVNLTNEQTILLQNSLIFLQKENKFTAVFYWGQIYGLRQDYYIAFGFTKDALLDRKMFYSIDLTFWSLLPHAKKKHKHLALLSRVPLIGDPCIKAKVMDESLDEFNADKCKELKEENRLAALVGIICEEAELCARSQYMKKPDGSVILNDHFYGLNPLEGGQVKTYMHFRIPQQRWNTNLLTRADYNYSFDFLDTIDNDVPSGCWNLALERGGTVVCLRSLYWPGMFFFHKLNSCEIGFTYMGNGKKNLDVCNDILIL